MSVRCWNRCCSNHLCSHNPTHNKETAVSQQQQRVLAVSRIRKTLTLTANTSGNRAAAKRLELWARSDGGSVFTASLGGFSMNTIDCPKCGHEHQPTGSHEDDSGEMECEACGFKFEVEVDYDPSYSTSCVTHEWGEFENRFTRSGEIVEFCFCLHCQCCELRNRVDT